MESKISLNNEPKQLEYGIALEKIPTELPYLREEELKKQLNALLKQIEDNLAKIDNQKQHQNMPSALEEFLHFFQEYNNYFLNEDVKENIKARYSNKQMAYERVLSIALEHTRSMWNTFSQAINQRYNPVYEERFKDADQLAHQLLERSQNLVEKEPIIYFDKIFHITRYPYQIYPLLGVPFDRYEQDGPSAMAHELGHHVFWNTGDLEKYRTRMQILKEEIASAIFSNPLPQVKLDNPTETQVNIESVFEKFNIWMLWAEETFADIYGTLLIGPSYAKQAQDFLVRENIRTREDLIQNDGEHPMPALRPFISLAVLDIVAKQGNNNFKKTLEELINVLKERWNVHWQESTLIENSTQQHNPLLTASDMKNDIETIVNGILNAKMFPVKSPDESKYISLIESVGYWGNNRTQEDINEIENLINQCKTDKLDEVPSDRNHEFTAKPIGAVTPGTSPFEQLLKFVRDDRKRREEVGEKLSKDEWEDVLSIELMRTHYHSQPAFHEHKIWHKHDGFSIIQV
ncbi:hypothetical protein [Nostoc sp. UIC 10630]|uniref:hypothetical protein n=1 Tax=Nostoc sp. UIC 10630 TaxID=2100146 RepID=UPI0013D87AC9|nr:hypothetical protein [Nostoc sp. UIC 10630]NEU81348.1 hypothetical protein [Nostoc sp. UIC 10630]